MTGLTDTKVREISLREEVLEAAKRVADDAAAVAADEVDQKARFPSEAVSAMKAERLLSALAPTDFGGAGAGVVDVAQAVSAIGRQCSSAGMVLAIHQIQVACLANHGNNDVLRSLPASIARDQLLIASATTEKGVGGDIRSSKCALQVDDGRFSLTKDAMVISYGKHADVVLATARRTPDSSPHDQAMVACGGDGLVLEPIGDWDVLGFRGTCSLGFRLVAAGEVENVFLDSFGDICASTMLPVSHVLWSSLWSGMTAAAVDKASRFVRLQGRAEPGFVPPAATRLAELVACYQQMSDVVHGGGGWFVEVTAAALAQRVAILVQGWRPVRSWFNLAPGTSRPVALRAFASTGMSGPSRGRILALNARHGTPLAQVSP